MVTIATPAITAFRDRQKTNRKCDFIIEIHINMIDIDIRYYNSIIRTV